MTFAGHSAARCFDVDIAIGAVELRLCGFTVIARAGKFSVRVPTLRDECGRWMPAVSLLQELHEPISKLAIEQLGLGRPRGDRAARGVMVPTPPL